MPSTDTKNFKPLVRIDFDKAKRDTAARDEAKRRHDMQKKGMEKKYPFIKYDEPGNAKGGKVTKKAKGGSVSARADGIAKKGKTKTKQVAMKRGGMC